MLHDQKCLGKIDAPLGSPEERGLIKWLEATDKEASSLNDEESPTRFDLGDVEGDPTYDVPFITPWLKRSVFENAKSFRFLEGILLWCIIESSSIESFQ